MIVLCPRSIQRTKVPIKIILLRHLDVNIVYHMQQVRNGLFSSTTERTVSFTSIDSVFRFDFPACIFSVNVVWMHFVCRQLLSRAVISSDSSCSSKQTCFREKGRNILFVIRSVCVGIIVPLLTSGRCHLARIQTFSLSSMAVWRAFFVHYNLCLLILCCWLILDGVMS